MHTQTLPWVLSVPLFAASCLFSFVGAVTGELMFRRQLSANVALRSPLAYMLALPSRRPTTVHNAIHTPLFKNYRLNKSTSLRAAQAHSSLANTHMDACVVSVTTSSHPMHACPLQCSSVFLR